ncbi:uncharacterized protein LOC129291892 [Prosopis cineraria]|uniref:uncharacterized protein LOC129291892 n=1 Tax=Prosopis cineraria TaxID=364024 RepID=UPI002410A010|nr:uncharacterized protein LOC129291892 [Prosopis cineraria]
MSGPPRVRSMNVADSESRPVLVPAGNKARTTDGRKPASKPVKKPEQTIQEPEAKEKKPTARSNPQCVSVPTILKRQDHHQGVLSLSMNASCSSDASSTDSSTHSWASSGGKVVRRTREPLKKKNSGSKAERCEKVGADNVAVPDTVLADSTDSLEGKKRCAWVTPNTGILIPWHLFKVLCFSLFWPTKVSSCCIICLRLHVHCDFRHFKVGRE